MPNPFQGFGGAATYESLVGPVVTSDFTTTSASLVDITGMTVTLSTVSNPTKIFVIMAYSPSNNTTTTLSLNSTATKEYVWLQITGIPTRNSDFLSPSSGSGSNISMLLFGYLTGTTSGVVTKIQASIAGGFTLTVRVGSALYAEF